MAARRSSLSPRSVFITGGSRGLGLQLAREYGQGGARIALCARDADELGRAARDLRAEGIAPTVYVADITDRHAVHAAIARATEAAGTIDVLVNNAGTIEVGPRAEMTIDDYRRAMDTHFWGPFYAIEAVLPAMRARRAGRIANITSVGGRISVPHLLPYSASKFAFVGFSEGLRAELRGDGVLVTTVVPGLMRTGSPENARFKGRHRAEYAWFSILDSLPFISIDVTEAARTIVEAVERGDAELTLSIPAKIGALLHGIAPGLVYDLLGIVNGLLPGPGGAGKQSYAGSESHSAVAPSVLTAAEQQRAVTQNEISAMSAPAPPPTA